MFIVKKTSTQPLMSQVLVIRRLSSAPHNSLRPPSSTIIAPVLQPLSRGIPSLSLFSADLLRPTLFIQAENFAGKRRSIDHATCIGKGPTLTLTSSAGSPARLGIASGGGNGDGPFRSDQPLIVLSHLPDLSGAHLFSTVLAALLHMDKSNLEHGFILPTMSIEADHFCGRKFAALLGNFIALPCNSKGSDRDEHTLDISQPANGFTQADLIQPGFRSCLLRLTAPLVLSCHYCDKNQMEEASSRPAWGRGIEEIDHCYSYGDRVEGDRIHRGRCECTRFVMGNRSIVYAGHRGEKDADRAGTLGRSVKVYSADQREREIYSAEVDPLQLKSTLYQGERRGCTTKITALPSASMTSRGKQVLCAILWRDPAKFRFRPSAVESWMDCS
ncbi:hypothetical protein DFH06DRAFT_1139416 [Mycena polygramma]|nr:hypothetical protein DFH06DRAFT_1139416 [Mycena polygramma]